MKKLFAKIAMFTFLGVILSTNFVQAESHDSGRRTSRHDSRRCKFRDRVRSLERNLGIIRGTAAVTSAPQAATGAPVSTIAFTPTAGRGFSITGASIATNGGLTIIGVDITPTIYSVSVNVAFTCPFRNIPTVVASLMDSTTFPASDSAVILSTQPFITNVTTNGFTLNFFIEAVGTDQPAINNLVAQFLSSGAGFDFIATGGVRRR